MKSFLYIIFIFFLTPCNGSKKMGATAVGDTTNVVIIYQRGGCFGTCPAYTITINGANNMMIYEGNSNVDKIGKYSKGISKEDLKQLVDAFAKNGFNSMEDYYPGKASDFPHQYITFTNNGKTKKVNDGGSAPNELKTLESMLEKIASSGDWKKIEEQNNH